MVLRAIGMLVPLMSFAAPVSLTDAVTAAENWISFGEAIGTELSALAVGAQTYLDDRGEDAVHVVSLEGGGFVVTSTDDEIEPILAYSGTGTFNVDEGSPLAVLLEADVRARKAIIGQSGNGGGLRLMATAPVSANDEVSDNKSKWDRLLGRNAVCGLRLMAASGLPTVSTVCVAPLIQSKWNQSKVSTGPCYNYYTPNGYVCGCVATAMAQVMRYHKYPTDYVSTKTVECSVDGDSQSLTMKGGYYDWANMPLDPNGATPAQREAIGKLTYDCGVSVGMQYSSGGSGAYTYDTATALTGTFGYYSADYKLRPEFNLFHNLVTNDLQQTRPVLLGITGNGGHAIVADGYGFSSGALYYHLNMGWGGQDDLWYNLPTVSTSSHSYDAIGTLVYNIKPTKNTVIKQQTLEEALDNTSLRFTTGGDAEWYYQAAKTHDGEDAARSGAISNSKYTWMRTTVEGSGIASFWWKCDTGSALWGSDNVDFRVDGECSSRINGAVDWQKITRRVHGNGIHTLDWVYTKDSSGAMLSRADCAWVDQVEWTPMVTVTLDAQGGTVASNELFLARNDYNGYGYDVLPTPTWVNRTFLGWYTAKVGGTRVYYWSRTPSQDITLYAHWDEDRYMLWDDDAWRNRPISLSYYYTGGDAQWIEVSTQVNNGSFSFQSGGIGHWKTNWLEQVVNGPGRLTFCWKPSSEMGCDICTFSVNGEEEQRISGVSNEWSYVSCTISETGSHTLRWTYSKNGNAVKGSDCVWVDGITWQPEVSVTLDGNGGATYGWTSWGVTKYVGDEFAYLPSPTRTGYRFDGWFTLRNGGERVDANTIVTADLSMLYAHWLKEEPLASVLDTEFTVTTGGPSTWFGQTVVSCDGVDAACSGRLTRGQSNWMEITATGAGRIRFAWAIDGYEYSNATYNDSLAFVADGVEKARIAGKQDWTDNTFCFEGGTHTFRWKYTKNGFYPIGADCAWVDGVVWEPEAWVFFKPEGGVLSQTWCRGYVGDEVLLPTPMRDGYAFAGWFTEEDGGERVEATSFVLDRTRCLYARWSFTGVSANDYRNESIYLTWGLSPEAALYSVYRSTKDDWSGADWLSDRTYRWYFDYMATPGVDYWYWVATVDADGNRAYSNAVRGRREVSLSLGADEMSHGVLAGSEMVDVYANTSWRAVSSAAWLKLTTSSGTGNGILSYTFSHNFSRAARDATITVTAGGETAYPKTLTIYVSQSGWSGGVSLESDEYEAVAGVPFDGNEIVPEVVEGYALKVTGLPSGLKFDTKTGMIIGVPTAKAGAYAVTLTTTPNVALKNAGAIVEMATITINVTYPILTLETEAWDDESAAGTVKGGGATAANKKVTLTATPAKGCVFVGWHQARNSEDGIVKSTNGAVDYRTTSYPYVMTAEDATLVAMFATKEEDAMSLKVAVEDVTTEQDGSLDLDLGACVESLSLPKLAVTGLPKGLKFDAKTLKITGKATKPGVYTVTVKATNASVTKAAEASTVMFTITVPNFKCDALPNLLTETDAYDTVMCGVIFDVGLVDCTPASGWSVKVAGLPAGLKWDAKTGAISGVPTAKAGAYTVTFTASKKGEANQVATITLNIDALPEWAVGTFDGTVWNSEEGIVNSEKVEGIVTLTVAANGKISGKVINADGTWTLAAAAYSSVECLLSDVQEPPSGSLMSEVLSPVFHATVIGKNGKKAITNEVTVSAEEVAAAVAGQPPYRRGVVNALAARSTGSTGGSPVPEEWTAWQNLWKAEPWKTVAKSFAKAPTLAIELGGGGQGLPALPGNDAGTRDACPYPGTITLKFAASGAVTASGKFVTGQDARGRDVVHSASCSSVLVPVADSAGAGRPPYRIFLYFPPKAGKFDGYSAVVPLAWDGKVFSISEQ